MANTNFVIAVPAATVAEFKSLVINAASENDVVLMDRIASGNGQAWHLSGNDKPKPTVIAYDNGRIVWQNLNPKRLGIECTFLQKWGNG